MLISNVRIFNENHVFEHGSIRVKDGMITEIIYGDETVDGEEEVFDGNNMRAIPGLVDIHFHGCMGVDLCDARPDGIDIMAHYEKENGITTICPATMTMSRDELKDIMKVIGSYEDHGGSHFAGINMEGPFISPRNKGAQAGSNIIPCDVEFFNELQELSKNRIRVVDIAPEEPGAMEFIKAVSKTVPVSIAHTKSDYDTAMEAFQNGADHVTHLCNAMPPLHHRDPGVIAAAMDAGAYVELITDGIHIHPAMVRAIFKMFGPEKICLISDSMRATGLMDGAYTLGGQNVYVKGALATLADGTIAGSVTNLMKGLKICIQKMGIAPEDAIPCATENPAKSIGIFKECGSIAVGKRADLVIINDNFDVLKVF
ncbi:MAG: N-acetylglucosamine-6-phosphate deacetylase [Brotaphodocola sp.]